MITKDFYSKRAFRENEADVVQIRTCGSRFWFSVGHDEEILKMRYYPVFDEMSMFNEYLPDNLKQKNLAVIMAWLRPLREWRHVEKTLNEWILN